MSRRKRNIKRDKRVTPATPFCISPMSISFVISFYQLTNINVHIKMSPKFVKFIKLSSVQIFHLQEFFIVVFQVHFIFLKVLFYFFWNHKFCLLRRKSIQFSRLYRVRSDFFTVIFSTVLSWSSSWSRLLVESVLAHKAGMISSEWMQFTWVRLYS